VGLPSFAAKRHVYVAAGRVLDGIGQEVRHNLRNAGRVTPALQTSRRVQNEPMATRPSRRDLDLLANHCHQVAPVELE
jgi:hypothetical protein